MRFMAANPRAPKSAPPACRLEPFEPRYADLVLSWISSPEEAYWVAPRTAPPLTAEEVLQWQAPGHQPFLLYEKGRAEPIGYGELNVLGGYGRRYWLGHLIVDPVHRGRGHGQLLTRLLLWRAFSRHAASEVSLVVFPENRAAILCYEAAGMRPDGYETHQLASYQRKVRLLRMVARGIT
jgi:RimJ/RimL family protein N-acetyltransferase